MESLKGIRKKLFDRQLQAALRQQRVTRSSSSYDEVSSVGIVFNATELKEREQVLAFAKKLKAEKKKVKLLGFMDNSFDNDKFTFLAFSKKDLNWLFIPKGKEVKDFMEKPFDLLINLTLSPHPATEYVSALSRARFRATGVHTYRLPYYELMIDLSTQQTIPRLIEQITHFLTKMQSTNGKAVV
jgi:hypothetical protein